MNDQNLTNLKDRTPEERKRIAGLGGKASGVKKRQNKMLKELLLMVLREEDVRGETYEMGITKALVEKALQGDTKAYELVAKMTNQLPKEEVELSTGNTIEINITNEGK